MTKQELKPKILLVDDNEAFLDLFLVLEEADNFDIVPVTSAEDGLKQLEDKEFDMIITDIQLKENEMTGIDLFKNVQNMYPNIPVILITAYGSAEDAINAVKNGAFHYFEKPIDDKLALLWTTVREAIEKRKRLCEIESLQKEKSYWVEKPESIIGQSDEIKKVYQAISDVAGLPVNVLIFGDTGTGKELVARAIHDASDRREKPFFAVNCSAFASTVLESELFGHEKGAFTGADSKTRGVFEIADKGSLFLDEIGDASLSLQAKLLRVIETHTFKRVGGTQIISSDFRLIAATNADIEKDIENGDFRQDLFYRLNVYTITLPPLKDRKEDIPLIADYYVNKFSKAYNRDIKGIADNATAALINYEWPGNVRELVNIIERAVITCREQFITTSHFPFETDDDASISDLDLKEMEKFYIKMALKRTENNKTRAAELLSISRKTLIEKVKKYKIK